MLKKRLIFTLLYDSGFFVLSRNFRLQRVGDINWLKKNYNFEKIAFHIDELVILNVSRKYTDMFEFSKVLSEISENCFVPISAGGGIKTISDADLLLKSGADKIIVNSLFINNIKEVKNLISAYGKQFIVGSIDYKKIDESNYIPVINNGTFELETSLNEYIHNIIKYVGEIYLNSIDRDGTGDGLLIDLFEYLNLDFSIPIIFAGGVGHWEHIYEGLSNKNIDSVATANLFNFVGDGLSNARKKLIINKVSLASWPEINQIK